MLSIRQSCFDYIWDDYQNSKNKVEWLRNITSETGYVFQKTRRIIWHAFGEQYHINMFQKKGYTELQQLIKAEIERHMNHILRDFEALVFKEFNVTSYDQIFNPPPVGTPTDIDAIQCFICATNKKDRALQCGHSYCCCCIETMPNGKCPECNTIFDKTKVIKLYL